MVLEARTRIGGRIWTDTSLGTPVDLGAAWMHGTDGNPLMGLVDEVGARTVETDFDNVALLDNGLKDGAAIDARSTAATLRTWAEAMAEIGPLTENAGPDASLDGALADVVNLDDPLIQWCVASSITAEYAADPDELALRWFGHEGELSGPDLILPGGYGQLLNHLARGLTVKLGTEVTRIGHDDSGVRVETVRGDVIAADRVIVTVPLGVLKANAVVFDPPLPELKRQAIDRLGFGLLDKVVLRFDEPFWPQDPDTFGIVGRDQPVCDVVNGSTVCGSRRYRCWLGSGEGRMRLCVSRIPMIRRWPRFGRPCVPPILSARSLPVGPQTRSPAGHTASSPSVRARPINARWQNRSVAVLRSLARPPTKSSSRPSTART